MPAPTLRPEAAAVYQQVGPVGQDRDAEFAYAAAHLCAALMAPLEDVADLAADRPAADATNLVTNPSFEVDLAGYDTLFVAAATVARVADGSGHAMEVTCPASPGYGQTYHNAMMLTAGVKYTACCRLRLMSGAANIDAYIAQVDAPHTTFLVASNVGPAASTEYWLTFTPTVSGEYAFAFSTHTAAASVWRVDKVLVAAGVVAYFDGDSPNARWTGTPHASPSERLSQTSYRSGWSDAVDLSRAPDFVLGWLAQFTGVQIRPGTDPAEARRAISTTEGFERGTRAGLISDVKATLTGTKSVRVIERAADPHIVTVLTSPAETPDSAATLAAARDRRRKPLGVHIDLIVSDDPVIDEMTRTIDSITQTIDGLHSLADVT